MAIRRHRTGTANRDLRSDRGQLFCTATSVHDDGYAGPYRIALSVEEGRLALEIKRADGAHRLKHTFLALGRFRRPIRDYFAICDSYYQAIKQATPQQIETVDMARRGIHNDAAEMLKERLVRQDRESISIRRDRLFHANLRIAYSWMMSGSVIKTAAVLLGLDAHADTADGQFATGWHPSADQYPLTGP